jgi:hypothetical protein
MGEASVAIQSGGNVVVASYSSSTSATLTDFSSAGVKLWRNSIGAPSLTRADNVRVDALGNIYVAGSTYTNSYATNQGHGDVTLQKFSSSGVLQWGTQFGTPQFDWPAGLAVTSNGTCCITSGGWATNYAGSPAGSNTTIHQYLSDGTAGWVANLNTGDGTSPGATAEGNQGTAIDAFGNTFAAFQNYTSTILSNGSHLISFYNYLSKTDSSGQVQWVKPVNTGAKAAVDPSGDVYLSGGYLEKFDPSGNLIWSDPNTRLDFQAICVADDGTLYASERTTDSIDAFDANGNLLSTTVIPHSGYNIVGFDDLATIGNELAASAQIASGSTIVGDEVAVLSVPEPQLLTPLLAIFTAMLSCRENRRKPFTRGNLFS